MFRISGGNDGGREYSSMYDVAEATYKQSRYDTKNDIVGFEGIVTINEKDVPAMLWFSGDSIDRLRFVKGERYFPKIDKTYEEMREALSYDLDAFEPTDTQGYEMEGTVTYLGSQYSISASLWDDTAAAWEEAIIVQLAEQLSEKETEE